MSPVTATIVFFLPTLAICGALLRYQHQQIQARAMEESVTTKRLNTLTEQLVASQKAIKKLAEITVDLAKKNNVKVSLETL